MKKILGTTTFVLTVAVWSSSYGQNPAIEMGSQAQFAVEARERQQAADREWHWRNARKLTLSGAIPKIPRTTLPPANLHNGSTGYLELCPYIVKQITGPTDMLLAFSPKNPNIPSIWLTDYPTAGLADGDQVRLIGLVKIDGTKSYTTASGDKKTVRVVRLVKQKISQPKKGPDGKVLWFRIWTDNTGKYTMVGNFYALKNNLVYLGRKDNGKTIKVPMSRLSKKDQEWIRDEIKFQQAKEKKQTEKKIIGKIKGVRYF